MGYRERKNASEKKWRALKLTVLCFVVLLLTGLCVFSAFCPPSTWKYYVKKTEVPKRQDGELRIHMLDVGQAECILLEFPDDKTVLIDGGDGREKTNKTILRYLNALDIDAIDCLLITHQDADHCGGIATIVNNKTVKTAYLPFAEPTENTSYAKAYSVLLEEGCPLVYASYGQRLGNENVPYTFTCLYPNTELVEESTQKDISSVYWLDYYGVSALFTGDGDLITEEKLIFGEQTKEYFKIGVELSSTEILKVGHHGSETSTSAEFLSLLGVKTALISCGENNLHGHPSKTTLNRLLSVGATTYRTDTQGHILVTIFPTGEYEVETI